MYRSPRVDRPYLATACLRGAHSTQYTTLLIYIHTKVQWDRRRCATSSRKCTLVLLARDEAAPSRLIRTRSLPLRVCPAPCSRAQHSSSLARRAARLHSAGITLSNQSDWWSWCARDKGAARRQGRPARTRTGYWPVWLTSDYANTSSERPLSLFHLSLFIRSLYLGYADMQIKKNENKSFKWAERVFDIHTLVGIIEST